MAPNLGAGGRYSWAQRRASRHPGRERGQKRWSEVGGRCCWDERTRPVHPIFTCAGQPRSSREPFGRPASVPGIPRSRAALSAVASNRRIRPATASLVSGGLCSWPNSSREEFLCSRRSVPAARRWSGTSSPRISSARSTRAPAATAARAERRRLASSKLASLLAEAHLAAHPTLLPGHQGLVGTQPGQHGRDRVPVPDHHAVDIAHLARLRGNLQSSCGADQCQSGLRTGAGDLQGHRAPRFGE